MNTINDTDKSTRDHGQADCRCPDDRCAGYHHEVGEPCPCTPLFEPVTEFDPASIVHPDDCYGDCVPEGGATVEHVTAMQVLSTGTVTATGSLRILTTHRDYREDDFRRDIPEIKVTSPSRRVASVLTGAPEDLKALGEFIISQADRFKRTIGAKEAAA